jgi:hypothetical protein
VRELGGVPRVFSEYAPAGTLEDWIRTERLYAGGERAALARILDVAIQFAWGLHYAHWGDLPEKWWAPPVETRRWGEEVKTARSLSEIPFQKSAFLLGFVLGESNADLGTLTRPPEK